MKKERHWVLPAIWAILLMLLLGGAVWAYQAFSVADWQSLDPSRLTSLAQTGAIHDKNGDYVTSLVGKENRTVIDTSRLPAHVVNAFLAAEDLRFYKHPGFDITRIIGAMLTNVRDGAFSQGASTISQQLIKLSHLSSQKTIARKLEEIHLALQLEKQYTKDEILDMYLNFIYFGQGAYGVQAAAEVTFGVDAAELTPRCCHQSAIRVQPAIRAGEQPRAPGVHSVHHAGGKYADTGGIRRGNGGGTDRPQRAAGADRLRLVRRCRAG